MMYGAVPEWLALAALQEGGRWSGVPDVSGPGAPLDLSLRGA